MMAKKFLVPKATSALFHAHCPINSKTNVDAFRYFGRAKDLPGVRELFQSKKKDQDEETAAFNHYKKFMDHGPDYYGDLDEQNEELLPFERRLEEEDWEEAYKNLREVLDIETDEAVPPYPHVPRETIGAAAAASATRADGKRKAEDGGGDVPMQEEPPSDKSKRTKKSKSKSKGKADDAEASASTAVMSAALADAAASDGISPHARAAAAFIPFLTPEELSPPKLPTRDEMEGVLLALRKRALLEEYFGDSTVAPPVATTTSA